MRKPGIEPGAQRWQRWILPLNHLRIKLILPRIELGTFCVLSRCHNQLDHKTNYNFFLSISIISIITLRFKEHYFFMGRDSILQGTRYFTREFDYY
ncbi:uncharacterized protein PRCAT00006041001 [Priceomyces carsonii]|uniref:uncharacterized protein n=1 Tax=Priceomyces carsonii TaxID=28549 RepID=UPI002ED91D3E|nr:unnamed protein product [Priceomyces carsonii]